MAVGTARKQRGQRRKQRREQMRRETSEQELHASSHDDDDDHETHEQKDAKRLEHSVTGVSATLGGKQTATG